MGKIILSISMSLDGFVAGTNISPQLPLGENGERLHDWIFARKTDADAKIVEELMTASGVVIVGRNTYDAGIDGGWGGSSPFPMPAIIVSKTVPEELVEGFIFQCGIDNTLAKAKEIAGDKDIWVMGGANIAQQFISADHLDEIQINLAAILLGSGIRLFEDTGHLTDLEIIRIIETPAATHIKYSVKGKS
ncbi:MAG: dihydrofolate reductase family protein [Chitinophagales bacterium]